MVSPASKTSAWLFRTCWASVWVFDSIVTSILSRWRSGMSGTLLLAHFGFLTTLNDLFGTMSVTMYGPLLGGRSVVSVGSGVPHGTSPISGKASTFVNAP